MPKLTKKERNKLKSLDRKELLKGRVRLFTLLAELEKETNALNGLVMKDVLKYMKKHGYQYNAALVKQIRREFNKYKDKYAAINTKAAVTIAAISKTTMKARASKFGAALTDDFMDDIISKVKLDKLSTRLHSANIWIRNKMTRQVKKSIRGGESVIKLANKLNNLENVKVAIPKHIKEIAAAAKKAINQPEHYAAFRKVLKKHERYIDELTRAGADGFQHLGIRGATRRFAKQAEKFAKDMKGATTANIDTLVNEWAAKKALNVQKNVARHHLNLAFNQYNKQYMEEAEYYEGKTWTLSSSHPKPDICDELSGDYYKKDGPAPELIVDSHYLCLCYYVAIVNREITGVTEEAA
jgi:hypothetical protein